MLLRLCLYPLQVAPGKSIYQINSAQLAECCSLSIAPLHSSFLSLSFFILSLPPLLTLSRSPLSRTLPQPFSLSLPPSLSSSLREARVLLVCPDSGLGAKWSSVGGPDSAGAPTHTGRNTQGPWW